MNVNQLFEFLAVGELSTLSVADKDLGTLKYSEHPRGTLKYSEHPRFIRYLNDALTLIYTKMAHNKDYVNFSLVTDQNTYPLQPSLATNILKVISVQNLDYEFVEDRFYAINDFEAAHSVRTLQYDTLFFPVVVPGQNISVEYQAAHPVIPTIDYGQITIDIHPILESAVTSKIAASAFMALGGEDAMSKAATYMNDFNATLQLAEAEDMAEVTSIESANRFKNFGWQ